MIDVNLTGATFEASADEVLCHAAWDASNPTTLRLTGDRDSLWRLVGAVERARYLALVRDSTPAAEVPAPGNNPFTTTVEVTP